MLRGTVVNVAALPARSVTTTCLVSPAPSVLKTIGLVVLVDASPDSASLRVNGMLTLVLFQPFTLAAGEGVPKLSTGGVASRFTVTELLADPPPERTLQVNVTPAVSVVTLLVPQPLLERMLAGDSLTAQLTCTSLVNQPLLPRTPLIAGATDGVDRSMDTAGVSKVPLLPAPSTTTTWVRRLAPSPVMITGLLLFVEATPDMASVASNAKLTSLANQPTEFGAGVGALNASCGGVASRLTVIVLVVEPPADDAVQVNETPAVSDVTALASQPSLESIGAWSSLVVQAT